MPLPLLCIRHKQNNFFSLKRNKNQDNDEDADDDEERRGILYEWIRIRWYFWSILWIKQREINFIRKFLRISLEN